VAGHVVVQNLPSSMLDDEKAVQQLLQKATELAAKLTANRTKQVKPLQDKVNKLLTQVGMPNARLQVYFLENEDLFKRKYIFHDEKEKWFEDNGLRTVFFCKGALETVKKFGWPPDIIHCSGWMTGLIPFYLKTVYKKEPVFAHSKVVFTIGQNTFKEKLGVNFSRIANIHASIKEKELEPFAEATNTALFRAGASFADAITFGAEKADKKLVEEFSKVRGKKVLPYNTESDLSDYMQLYTDLSQ